MNILALGICYALASVVLFLYGICSRRNALRSYGFAIALNVVPLVPFGWIGSEVSRLGRIPIAYMPMIAAMMSALFVSRLRVLREDTHLLGAYLILISYLLVQSLSQITHYDSFLQYYQGWVINIYSMLAVSWIAARIPRQVTATMLRNCIILLAGCAWIGILKNLVGLTEDANFMPMQNRNATVILIVLAAPLTLMIRDLNRMGTFGCAAALLTFSVSVLLMRSRVGLFSFVFAVAAYFCMRFAADVFGRHRTKLRVTYLVPLLAVGSLLFIALLASPLGEGMIARAADTPRSVRILLGTESLSRGEADYGRVDLLRAGIYVVKKNFVWGTGVGLENYLEELREFDPSHEARPHNFYVSCLGEFGVIGFSVLLVLLFLIFRRLGSSSNEKGVSPELPLISCAFRSIVVTLLFASTMNEYLSLPLLWAVFGLGLGMTAENRCEKSKRA